MGGYSQSERGENAEAEHPRASQCVLHKGGRNAGLLRYLGPFVLLLQSALDWVIY